MMWMVTKVDGWIRKFMFLSRERIIATVDRPAGLRVLFSRQDQWEPMIRAGLRGTRHLIAFGELPAQQLAAYDVVVPLTVDAVLYLAACSGDLLNNWLPVPAADCVKLCDDKVSLNQALTRLGFGRHIPAMLAAPAPPFILKPRIGANSEGCHIVQDDGDLARVQPWLADDRFFCQQLVRGSSEFASHILFRHGKIVAELTIEYIAADEVFVKGNGGFHATKIRRCPCPELFAEMLAALGFQGLCCINFKLEGGHPWLLEINPRFGYSLGPYFSSFLQRIATRMAVADESPVGR